MSLEIKTDRLLLRPLALADAPALVPLIGDYEVARWLTVVPHPYTLADGETFVREIAGPWDRAITLAGELIGVVGISGGLGYWLGRPFWGHGYMSEAAAALVEAWFSGSQETEPTEQWAEGSTRPRGGEKRPPVGAAGRCPALPPGGTAFRPGRRQEAQASGRDARGGPKETLTSGHFLDNAASARILQKLGFTPAGTEQVHARALGRTVELQRMVLTRAAWEARHG